MSSCYENPTEGQCYLPGRPCMWLPWANEVYSNYWTYYFHSQMKLQKYLYLCLSPQQTVFQSQASGEENSNKDIQHRTGQLLLASLGGWERLMLHDKSWKNHDLPGSSDRGCGWNTDVLYDRHLCRRDVDKTIMINHHSQGVNEGKNVHEDISKLGWSWQRPLYVWKKYKQWCKWSRWDE